MFAASDSLPPNTGVYSKLTTNNLFVEPQQKPLGQLEPILAGMFLGWSSTKILFFVPVGYSTWLPGPIICSDWLKFQRSSSEKKCHNILLFIAQIYTPSPL
jgi:hypothetical protein